MNPTPIPRTFTATIDSLRYGTLGTELSDELRKLVNAVTETGKAGKLTLAITIKPGKGQGPMEVIDDIAVKLPKAEKGSSLMYPTPEGHLQRHDPRQPDLPGIRVVDQSTGEVLDVRKTTTA